MVWRAKVRVLNRQSRPVAGAAVVMSHDISGSPGRVCYTDRDGWAEWLDEDTKAESLWVESLAIDGQVYLQEFELESGETITIHLEK